MLNVPCVCSLQLEERQKQPSGAAPPQEDGHPAAASTLRHGCSSNGTTATSSETLGNGADPEPETSNDHKAGLCARNLQTSPVGRTGSGHPSGVALNLGDSSEEEKQDQSKDEPCLELRQQDGCECECALWC